MTFIELCSFLSYLKPLTAQITLSGTDDTALHTNFKNSTVNNAIQDKDKTVHKENAWKGAKRVHKMSYMLVYIFTIVLGTGEKLHQIPE